MAVSVPEDLVTDILARLPVKCLMRFKCVQRSWNALFRTPNFVTKHMHMQMHRSDEHLMTFYEDSYDYDYHSRKYCISHILCDQDQHQVQAMAWPFADKSFHTFLPIGTSNGVFCLSAFYNDRSRQVILWNPATREVKVVPPPPHSHSPSQDEYLCDDCTLSILPGFGVDPCTNDFKIVNIVFDNSEDKEIIRPAEVYNLSTNSWTIIHDSHTILNPITCLTPSYTSALANGVDHWLIDYFHVGNYRDILCFDFRNNQFRKLTAPIARPASYVHDDIAAVNESLAYVMTYHYANHQRFEIWVMNEDDSWTIKYNVSPLPTLVWTKVIWKGGAEILGGVNFQPLVSYNSSDAQPVRQFQNVLILGAFSIYNYLESIAPLSV